MTTQGARVVGHETLAQGSIITGMIWGGFTALIIDGKFKNAGYFAIAAAAMSSVGILHAPALTAPTLNPVVIGYLITGLFLIIYPMVADVKPLHPETLRKPRASSCSDISRAPVRVLFGGWPPSPPPFAPSPGYRDARVRTVNSGSSGRTEVLPRTAQCACRA